MDNPFRDTTETDPDEELVARAQGGDREALDQLLTRHQPWVFNIAIRMLGRWADAEDATQDILLRTLKSIRSAVPPANFRTMEGRVADRSCPP